LYGRTETDVLRLRLLRRDNNVRFFLVEKCIRFLFWSKVEAACGLEIVITVITVIGSPFYTDHMDGSASLGFFPAYLRSGAS
jgi:Ni,Fe-hydrogenase I cytochrome b subunit